jgi:hypothetical protein
LIFGTLFVLALLAVPAFIYYLDWRIPRATATVQVHPLWSTSPSNGFMTSDYMENEFEAILSKETLTMAAESLGISEDERDEALILMKKSIVTAPVRGSDFIEIIVKDQDPKKAAKVANAVAEAYAQNRAASANDRSKRALKALDEELNHQRELVAEHRADLEAILQRYDLEFPSDNKSFPEPNELQINDLDELDGTVDLSLRQNSYNQALETFTQSREMLREMKIKQDEARILLKVPFEPITIHQRAE